MMVPGHVHTSSCDRAAKSQLVPGHVHTCSGAHLDDDLHMCSDSTCRRWFG